MSIGLEPANESKRLIMPLVTSRRQSILIQATPMHHLALAICCTKSVPFPRPLRFMRSPCDQEWTLPMAGSCLATAWHRWITIRPRCSATHMLSCWILPTPRLKRTYKPSNKRLSMERRNEVPKLRAGILLSLRSNDSSFPSQALQVAIHKGYRKLFFLASPSTKPQSFRGIAPPQRDAPSSRSRYHRGRRSFLLPARSGQRLEPRCSSGLPPGA